MPLLPHRRQMRNTTRHDTTCVLFFVSSRAERFVVLDHAHRSLVQVQPIEEGGGGGSGPYEHCFNLTLLENHQGRMMERLFKAPSQ